MHPGMTLQNCYASGNAVGLLVKKTETDNTAPMIIDGYVGRDSVGDDIVINDASGSSAKTFISNAYSHNAGRCGVYAISNGSLISNFFIRNMNIYHPVGWPAATINNYLSTPISDSELEINCYGGSQPILFRITGADNVILKGSFLMDSTGGTTGISVINPVDLTFKDSEIKCAKVGAGRLLRIEGAITSLRLSNLDLSLIHGGTATYGIQNSATGAAPEMNNVRLHNGLT